MPLTHSAKQTMKNFIPSLWDHKELLDIYDNANPTLEERTNILLSYWNNFEHKVTINNREYAQSFIKNKHLRENLAQIRGKTIGFEDKVLCAEFVLKQKNV